MSFLSPTTLFVTYIKLYFFLFILWNMASTTVEKDVAAVGLIRSNGQVKTKDASSTDNETVCESMPEGGNLQQQQRHGQHTLILSTFQFTHIH